ncbi:hypothetical protein BGX24_000512 [Mortierella sp. AD032]|nr:hypothetical protein BGX24_000512 [Mortierella sp. AD032]
MQPTSFLASRPSLDTTSASNDSFFNSTSAANPTKTTPDTPAAPIPAATKPFMGAAARTRDASVSSLPGPRHEDMIIPVVAKRIKEQGLYDHDVVAYSDDYNAPLYKAPSTPANVGNPFASYDRMKAASSMSLSNPKSPPGSSPSAYDQVDQAMDRNKARRESKDDYNQASTSEHPAPPLSPPLSNTSPDLSTGQPTRKQRERKETIESQQQQSFNDPSSSGNSSPVTTRPDRPRRARRNTERSTRHDQYATFVDCDAQNAPLSPQVPLSPISRQEYLERTQQPSWDRPYITNSAGQDPYAPSANTPTRQEITQNLGANSYQRQDTREQGYESYYQQDTYNNNNQQKQQQQQQQYQPPQQQYQQRQQQQQFQQQSYIDNSSNNNYYHSQAAGQNNDYQDQQQQQQQQGRTQSGRSRPEMVQVEMSTMGNGSREGEASEEQKPHQVVQVDARDTIKKEKKGSVCCIVM